MQTHARFLLDQEMFEKLKAYLEDKKGAIREALSLSLTRPLGAPQLAPPAEKGESEKGESLTRALTHFNREWESRSEASLRSIDEMRLVERLSGLLLNYVEILEGMGRELFEELKSLPVDQWDQNLYERLEAAKVYLWMKLQEAQAFFEGLEASLKRFVIACKRTHSFAFFKTLPLRFSGLLDPEIGRQLKKTAAFVQQNFENFSQNFAALKKFEARFELDDARFQRYAILESLDKDRFHYFCRLWRFLKMWRETQLKDQAAYTLRHFCPPAKTLGVFGDYLLRLKERVFDLARQYRSVKDIAAQAVICSWRAEAHTLSEAIASFRDFLLKSDKAKKTEELNELLTEADRIDTWLAELFDAQELGEPPDPYLELMKFRSVDKLLQDMGQPLISESLMRRKTAELISELTKARELTSALPEVSDLMLDTLLRAFKADTKHETLTAAPGFFPLWEVHSGLSYPYKSASHLKRLKVYKKVTQHLKHWLYEQELDRHSHDIEHEIHDLQETLQEFYHAVNQGGFTPSQITEIQKELLEERVFFATFFQLLRKHNQGSRRIRSQFSFVDTYFNAIDDKLRALQPLSPPG